MLQRLFILMWCSVCFAVSTSHAISDTDLVSSISSNSKFTAVKDIIILANTDKTVLDPFDENGYLRTQCSLTYEPTTTERIMKPGTQLYVDYSEEIPMRESKGQYAKIRFITPRNFSMDCWQFSGAVDYRIPSNYRVPKVGSAKQSFGPYFKFEPAAPTEVTFY